MSKPSSKFYQAPVDQSGKEIKFDIREDEEQQVKLQETTELLVAAGYFRARIKGLSAFDKIVGGMTWCITTCNFDVDVDLLFQESSTIGQKIFLVERIVAVLPIMKCPHRIEPHQIQGLDFIHIYPVIQWLVKKAIETRAEMGDLNRSYALSQFSKMNLEKPNENELLKTQTAIKAISNIKESNAPRRKYVRKDLDKISDKQIKIQSTLLEYDQQQFLLSSSLSQKQQQEQDAATSNKASLLKQDQASKQQQEKLNQEEINIKRLIDEMSEADQKQNRVTASALGQIFGLQQSALQQIVSDFTNKENELQKEIEELEKLVASGDLSVGGFQQQQRLINVFNKQIEQKQSLLDEKQQEIDRFKSKLEEVNEKLNKLKGVEESFKDEYVKLEDNEKNADQKTVQELEKQVSIFDDLKQKEQEYKKKCKEELSQLQIEIERLNTVLSEPEEKETYDKIVEQHESSKSKLQALRLKIAKKNREISTMKRKIDEIPSGIELTQYQKRFVELYNQTSAVLTQTKQFYIFYNVLEDKKLYMNKEINLLNSIHDQFNQAMSTQANREQFVKQLDNILDAIRNNLSKVESKKVEAKSNLDKLNDRYVQLNEKKRIYYKTLKDFQEECKKNELLQAKTQ